MCGCGDDDIGTIPMKGDPIKYDPTFRGPLHRRSCTDVICLLAFIVFLVAWAAVSGYAIVNGDVRRLLVPADSTGRKCGLDSGVDDKPYLVFFDMKQCLNPSVPINGCPTTQVCVKKCPEEQLLYSDIESDPSIDLNALKQKIVCTPETDLSAIRDKKSLLEHLDDKKCARDIFPSKSTSKRCLPTNYSDLTKLPLMTLEKADIIKENMNILNKVNQMGTMIIEDLVSMRWWIVLGLVFVMLICLIYITLLRWVAAPIVWFSILGSIALLCYSIYYTFTQFAYYRDHPVVVASGQNLSAVVQSMFAQKDTWLVLLIAACITLFIVLIMIIFLRKRIVLAIALIKEGSKAVGSVKSTLFFPIFPWVFQVLTLALGVVVCLYLASIGTPIYKSFSNNQPECLLSCGFKEGDACEPKSFIDKCGSKCDYAICHFTGTTNPQYIYWFQAVNVIGFFWLIFFIEGLGELILAATFATWYWTFKKSDVPFFTLTSSILRSFRFNLGTVAFGSLIITICRLIRLFLEYLDHKIKKFDNGLTRCILCCMKCFFACLESFLRFINKNAYIMCAVHGKGFLGSAKDAFSLLMRNILRVYVLDKVTDFLFFLSKLLVAVGCGAIAYFALATPAIYNFVGENKLHYDLVPPLIIGVAAFLIASVFFSVYSMAVDTLFLCFLEDCERNDGTPEKPYFMSKNLMKILGKKNKKTN